MLFIKKIRSEILIVFLVFILGAFLRYYQLAEIPLGLYVDEAAIGYNAYSISQTGKDEYGKKFPVYFRSFGDYKMPLYIYFSVIPIRFFGLNIFSVRFLSALSGSLTIFVVFLLVKSLFPEERKLSLISALLFAISPWSVFLSRMALEMQLGLFFLLLALFVHQEAIRQNKITLWMISSFLYALSAYSYHAEKFIAPLMFILWSFLNRCRTGKKKEGYSWEKFFLSTVLLMILLWPQIRLSLSPGAQARITSLSYLRNKQNLPFKGNFLAVVKKWGAMYTSYFSPRNLFYDPDPDPQRSLPDLSVFYPWMVIPLFVGIYEIAKKDNIVGKKFILLSLLIFPLPASLTGDPFSTFRALPLALPLCVLISLGILKMTTMFNRVVFWTLGSLIFLISLGMLWRSLFVLLPNERFEAWTYGYQELVNQINETNPSKVLIDDPIGVSYSEILFFQKYSPESLQKERRADLERYYQMTNWEKEVIWDKYEVRPIFWKKDIYQHQLIVARPLAISENQAKEHCLSKIFTIIGPGNRVIFNGYLTNPELKRLEYERKQRLKNESRNL